MSAAPISKPSQQRTGFVDLDSHQLFYKIKGSGPRVVVLTGTNTDTRHKPTIYDLPGAENFELLNFDHRGMGQSSTPDAPPTMESYADDIAKLMDFLDWENAAIIGISFGGMVAQHFALRYPEKTTKLVLCCTSSGGAGGASYPLHHIQDSPAEEFAATLMKLMNTRHTDAWQAENPEQARKIYDIYWQSANATLNNTRKYALMKLQFDARAKHDVFDQLKSIAVPTFIACGEEDGVATPGNAKALCKAIPNSRMEIFSGGHLFLREDLTAWPKVADFLNEDI